MEMTLCTIGFAGKTAEEFFRLLVDAGVQKVIDIRENRGGQLSGYAKYPDVEFFLKKVAGIGYVYAPQLAPSVEIRKAYRNGRDWGMYESSFLELMRERDAVAQANPADFEGTVALLCSEAGPEKCHRRLVAELLAGRWRELGHAVAIAHLVSERPATRKGKRSGARRPHRADHQ